MNSNVIFNLKKYLFLFVMTFAFVFFGFQNFLNAKIIPISDANNLSNISIENKDILQFDNKVTSVDLSKLPKIDSSASKKIVIETKGAVELKNSLPDKYELPLIITPYDTQAYGSGIPATTSYYFVVNGTESDPNYLLLSSSEFDLSLLPATSNKTYLSIMDGSMVDGIEFTGSLPENYIVNEIYIQKENDRSTFEAAFPKAKITKYESQSSSDISKDTNTSTLDTSDGLTSNNSTISTKNDAKNDTSTNSDNSTTTKNIDANKSSSTKTTGDNIMNFYVLGFCFLIFSSLSLVILFKKNKKN